MNPNQVNNDLSRLILREEIDVNRASSGQCPQPIMGSNRPSPEAGGGSGSQYQQTVSLGSARGSDHVGED